MAEPSAEPVWGTVGSDIVEPALAKKQKGWVGGERPPGAYFNYWQNLVYQWINWFKNGNHEEKEVAIHASAYHSPGSALGGSVGAVRWSGAGVVYADLRLPIGTRLKDVRQYYQVQATGSVHPKVKRIDITTRAASDVIAGTADSTAGGVAVQLMTANHVIAAGYAYFIEATITGDGLTMDAIIRYDRGVV